MPIKRGNRSLTSYAMGIISILNAVRYSLSPTPVWKKTAPWETFQNAVNTKLVITDDSSSWKVRLACELHGLSIDLSPDALYSLFKYKFSTKVSTKLLLLSIDQWRFYQDWPKKRWARKISFENYGTFGLRTLRIPSFGDSIPSLRRFRLLWLLLSIRGKTGETFSSCSCWAVPWSALLLDLTSTPLAVTATHDSYDWTYRGLAAWLRA